MQHIYEFKIENKKPKEPLTEIFYFVPQGNRNDIYFLREHGELERLQPKALGEKEKYLHIESTFHLRHGGDATFRTIKPHEREEVLEKIKRCDDTEFDSCIF